MWGPPGLLTGCWGGACAALSPCPLPPPLQLRWHQLPMLGCLLYLYPRVYLPLPCGVLMLTVGEYKGQVRAAVASQLAYLVILGETGSRWIYCYGC